MAVVVKDGVRKSEAGGFCFGKAERRIDLSIAGVALYHGLRCIGRYICGRGRVVNSAGSAQPGR